MTTITLELSELTPTTLAAIVANLSQNIGEGTADDVLATVNAMIDAEAALISIVGPEDALRLLQDAGADPDVILG